jgi:hypothetical protein
MCLRLKVVVNGSKVQELHGQSTDYPCDLNQMASELYRRAGQRLLLCDALAAKAPMAAAQISLF